METKLRDAACNGDEDAMKMVLAKVVNGGEFYSIDAKDSVSG